MKPAGAVDIPPARLCPDCRVRPALQALGMCLACVDTARANLRGDPAREAAYRTLLARKAEILRTARAALQARRRPRPGRRTA